MRELAHKLFLGIKQHSWDEQDNEIIKDLTKLNALSQKNGITKLKNDILVANVHKNKKHFGFLSSPFLSEDLYIKAKDLHGAQDGDTVLVQKKAWRFSVIYVFKTHKTRTGLFDARLNSVNEFLTGKEIGCNTANAKLQDGDVVRIYNGQIKETLGNVSDGSVFEKIIFSIFDRTQNFSKACEEECTQLKQNTSSRKDLSTLDFITIDPKTAKDFDDAIYYDEKKSTLYVAIADVSAYVKEGSQIDKEAYERGFSVYFAHKSVPMLPRTLSEDLCSLKEGVARSVFVCQMKFDGTQILHYEIYEAVIKSKKRFSYEQIDDIYNSNKKTFAFLAPLRDLVVNIRKERLKKGLSFHVKEFELSVDENLDIIDTASSEETFSHQLVEECMLCANICASQYFERGIFRVHPPIKIRALREIIDTLAQNGIRPKRALNVRTQIRLIQEEAEKKDVREFVDTQLIRSFKRAFYSHTNEGHFALGFMRYTHFTSPIRRYSDLCLHRYLKAIINKDNEAIKRIAKELSIYAYSLSLKEDQTNKMMRLHDDFLYTKWASNNIQASFDAQLIETNDETSSLRLENGARVFCVHKNRMHLGQNQKLKITHIDMLTAKIYGQIDV